MFIRERNTFQDENISMSTRCVSDYKLPHAAYPEDIPVIEAYDEESFNFSDGMYHIEDL